MDVLNFISWIKRKDYRETMPANALTVVGVPDPTRDDKYLSVVVPVSTFGVGAPYTLPIASASVLGGVKVGTNLSINGSGVLSAIGPQKGYINLTQTASNTLTAVPVNLTGTLTYDWSIADTSTAILFASFTQNSAVQTFAANTSGTALESRPLLYRPPVGASDAYKYVAMIKVVATDENGYSYPAYFNFSMGYTMSLYE